MRTLARRSGRGQGEGAHRPATNATARLLVATWAEALPLLGLHPRVTGMGRRPLDLAGASQVIFAGFAGACQAHLRPGDVVNGELRTLDHIAGPTEKADLGRQGVEAVDMEAAWAAEAAAAAGVPFVNVRVIIDGMNDRALSPATAGHYPVAALALRRAVKAALDLPYPSGKGLGRGRL